MFLQKASRTFLGNTNGVTTISSSTIYRLVSLGPLIGINYGMVCYVLRVGKVKVSIKQGGLTFSRAYVPIVCSRVERGRRRGSIPFRLVFGGGLINLSRYVGVLHNVFRTISPSSQVFPTRAACVSRFLYDRSLGSCPTMHPKVIRVYLVPNLRAK